jgi:hypothetical protein
MAKRRQTSSDDRAAPMNAYQLQLLGGFSLTADGETLSVPSDVRRLVAFLSLNRPSLPRSVVAGKLWSESTEDHASGSLRSALWRLRRVAPGLIGAEKILLSMHPGVALDVDQIIQAAETYGDPGIATSNATGININLLRRELLPGWYDDWVILERERLRQQSVHALESISHHLMKQRRFARAIDAAMSAIGIDPLRCGTDPTELLSSAQPGIHRPNGACNTTTIMPPSRICVAGFAVNSPDSPTVPVSGKDAQAPKAATPAHNWALLSSGNGSGEVESRDTRKHGVAAATNMKPITG